MYALAYLVILSSINLLVKQKKLIYDGNAGFFSCEFRKPQPGEIHELQAAGVVRAGFCYNVSKPLIVRLFSHIYEINYDDAGEVPQPDLTCYFDCCLTVHLKTAFLLILLQQALSEIDIYRDEL